MWRKRWWLLGFYCVALAASTHVRWHSRADGHQSGGMQVADIGVRLAFYDSDPHSSRPVLLLIHGSPGSSKVVRSLAELLKDEYRVIAPDLPGFGASSHDIPDYSFRA